MANSIKCGRILIIMVIVAAVYLSWTALSSSHCVTEGINNQTRTTWAPTGGCQVPDDYSSPWPHL